MADDDFTPAIVIDSGSLFCKAGFSGRDSPQHVFPSLVGSPSNSPQLDTATSTQLPSNHIGDSAQLNREMLQLKHPIMQGLITDWDAMEKLWGRVNFRFVNFYILSQNLFTASFVLPRLYIHRSAANVAGRTSDYAHRDSIHPKC